MPSLQSAITSYSTRTSNVQLKLHDVVYLYPPTMHKPALPKKPTLSHALSQASCNPHSHTKVAPYHGNAFTCGSRTARTWVQWCSEARNQRYAWQAVSWLFKAGMRIKKCSFVDCVKSALGACKSCLLLRAETENDCARPSSRSLRKDNPLGLYRAFFKNEKRKRLYSSIGRIREEIPCEHCPAALSIPPSYAQNPPQDRFPPANHGPHSSSRLLTLIPVLSVSRIPSACSNPADTTALTVHSEKHLLTHASGGDEPTHSVCIVPQDAAPPIKHTQRKTPRMSPQQLVGSVCWTALSRARRRVVGPVDGLWKGAAAEVASVVW